MGLFDFFKSRKKEPKHEKPVQEKKEKPFEGSWGPDTLSEDRRQAEEVAEQRHHVVQEGESLADIARKYYGDEKRGQVIYEANREEISHPEALRPGQRLYIPDVE